MKQARAQRTRFTQRGLRLGRQTFPQMALRRRPAPPGADGAAPPAAPGAAAPATAPAAPAPSPIAGLPNSLAGRTPDGPLARLQLVLHRVELTPEPRK